MYSFVKALGIAKIHARRLRTFVLVSLLHGLVQYIHCRRDKPPCPPSAETPSYVHTVQSVLYFCSRTTILRIVCTYIYR